jgi:hypothetical protein
MRSLNISVFPRLVRSKLNTTATKPLPASASQSEEEKESGYHIKGFLREAFIFYPSQPPLKGEEKNDNFCCRFQRLKKERFFVSGAVKIFNTTYSRLPLCSNVAFEMITNVACPAFAALLSEPEFLELKN